MRLSNALLAFFVFGVGHSSAASADDASVVAEINAAMTTFREAIVKHDLATIKRMMTPDHLAVIPRYGRPVTPTDELKALDGLKAKYVACSHTTVTVLAPAVVETTCLIHYEATFEGKPVPPLDFATQIWIKRAGTWQQQFYQETPIAP
jgi:ketosteroid isomerase-like protein